MAKTKSRTRPAALKAKTTPTAKPKPTPLLPGRASLFRNKIRGVPLTCLLTERHWRLLDRAAARLKLSRSDLVALLIDTHARSIQRPDDPSKGPR